MKWGLALSGGSLRGAAHIGVLTVLEENNLRPDFISGTSAGSLVAALYALGLSPKQMTEILDDLSAKKLYDLNLGWTTLFNLLINGALWLFKAPPEIYRSMPPGLLKGIKLTNWISEITMHRRFYDTVIPLAVMATDINTGEAICYHTPGFGPDQVKLGKKLTLQDDVSLTTALRASTAIPGIFTPVEVEGRLLVDGGVVDNLPSEVLRAMGANRVLAVNLGYPGQQKKHLDNAASIAAQAIDIMAREITTFRGVKAADYVLNPKIYDVGLTDFDKIHECVKRGRDSTLQSLPEIKALLS
jgi:NTE family protein